MYVTKWKKPIRETYILYNSFWKKQISLLGGSKNIVCFPGLAHLRTLFFREYLLRFHRAWIFQGPSWEMLFQTSNSQPGVILSPKGLLEIPEDLFGHHVLAGEVPWYTKWGETRMLPTFTAEWLSPHITATEPVCCSCWNSRSQSLCSATGEATARRSLLTTMKSGPHLLQLKKAGAQLWRPSAAKINEYINKEEFPRLKGYLAMPADFGGALLAEVAVMEQWKESCPDRVLETNAKLLQSRAAKGSKKFEPYLRSRGSVSGQKIRWCRLMSIILFIREISCLPLLFTGVWTQNVIAQGNYETEVWPQGTPGWSLLSPQEQGG